MKPAPPSDAEAVAALKRAIERDRSTVAVAVTAIKRTLAGKEWLREGRGNYEWNDDRWMKEFGDAIDDIRTALEPLRKVAADLTNSPTTQAEVQAARRTPTAAADRVAKLEAVAEAAEYWVKLEISGCRELPTNALGLIGALRAAGYLKDPDHG